MDVTLPDIDWLDAARAITREFPTRWRDLIRYAIRNKITDIEN
jgi:hypothetical protein